MTMLAAAFLLLSGIASLTYQVTWVRLLGLSMGSTSASISTVLAAFFLGLAVGSYLAERITRNRINNLNVYIALEVVIGISGLLLLPVLLNLEYLMASFPHLGSLISFKFFVALSLLFIPTVCMGATFPVMAAILIRKQGEVGIRVGQLYSLNTAGAVAGAALAGFVFIPAWGLDGAIYTAFTINLIIVALAFYLNRLLKLPPVETVNTDSETLESAKQSAATQESPVLRVRALIVLFATGFVAIASEVGWTKYLSIFTGTTIYGFAAILTVFLFGIAYGSWWVKGFLDRMRNPTTWMVVGLLALGVSLLFTRATLSMVPAIYEAINHFPVDTWLRHGVKYFFVFLVIFIPTFIFGALFPLNLKLYCGGLFGVRARIGKAYAVNTVASIFGSVFAGFWIIPQYGTDSLLTGLALAVLVLPLIFINVLNNRYLRAATATAIIVAISSNWLFPHISYRDLITSVQYNYDYDATKGKKPDVLYIKEGKAGVISMVSYDSVHVKLQNNGLNESFFDLEDENNVLLVEVLLGLVPYMLHDDPKSAFVVGFGGGITTRGLTFTERLEKIKVVELEPAVIEAGRSVLKGEIPALKDPRVTLQINDARNTLLLEKTKYDIIAAQPSHPWLARASNVFTRDFFQIVRSRLNEGGIYGQWVNLFHMDATTLRSIMKAFFEVFPQGMTFANLNTGDFILFGAAHKLVFDYEKMQERFAEEKIKSALNYHAIHKPQDLFWYFALSREQAVQASEKVVANTDLNIFSEVRLSAMDENPSGEEDPYKFLKSVYTLDVIPYLTGDINDQLLQLAVYFYSWDSDEISYLIADQLESIDEVMARSVRYERKWRWAYFTEAFRMFDEHEEWLDRTYVQHTSMLIDLERYDEAAVISDKIKDEIFRRVAKARLLYEQKQWQKLAALKPTSNFEKQWQLLGVAKSDLLTAGKQMLALENQVTFEIPQLRLLVRYFGQKGDARSLEDYSRKLIQTIDDKIERLEKVANSALKFDYVEPAEFALTQIKKLNPRSGHIKNIATRIGKIKSKLQQAENTQS